MPESVDLQDPIKKSWNSEYEAARDSLLSVLAIGSERAIGKSMSMPVAFITVSGNLAG